MLIDYFVLFNTFAPVYPVFIFFSFEPSQPLVHKTLKYVWISLFDYRIFLPPRYIQLALKFRKVYLSFFMPALSASPILTAPSSVRNIITFFFWTIATDYLQIVWFLFLPAPINSAHNCPLNLPLT